MKTATKTMAMETTAQDALCEVLPYASDINGVFRTGDATAYMKALGYAPGTSAATIFRWSDPTERVGYRRYRLTPRNNAIQPPELPRKNFMSGTMKVPGWSAAKPPRAYADVMNTEARNDIPTPEPVIFTPAPVTKAVPEEIPVTTPKVGGPVSYKAGENQTAIILAALAFMMACLVVIWTVASGGHGG